MIIKKEELAAALRAMADGILAGDSHEGRIEYTCLDPGCGPGEFAVDAFWRTGNSEGQGGCHIIGQ